ncbi:MAG TPA: redoxin family protein, partial [Nitrosopumilaceae archaeon]|nr:redoxin family protein [Nitrosopumilaceae archaeon]
PYLKKWYEIYKNNGFEIVGIHTPEFSFEKNITNVRDAVKRFNIIYPVALDNHYATWQAYDNHYWPAHYLVNQHGVIVYHHFGEGNYQETENQIRQLLGLSSLTGAEKQESRVMITPETYLGYARADRYHPDIIIDKNNIKNYQYTSSLPHNYVGLTGMWRVNDDCILSYDNKSKLDLNFTAHAVHLVMESKIPQDITVLLDNKPVKEHNCTKDMVQSGTIKVHEPRMYEIVNCGKNYGNHLLSLEMPKGVTAYVFTFG